MRSFVRIRGLLEADRSSARKFDRLERKLASHDHAIAGILAAIGKLVNPPERKRRGIGFTAFKRCIIAAEFAHLTPPRTGGNSGGT